MDNFRVIFENLPYSVNGFVLHNGCDDYHTIILNSRMSYDCNKRTFEHELKHIKNNDFETYKNVANIENVAHV